MWKKKMKRKTKDRFMKSKRNLVRRSAAECVILFICGIRGYSGRVLYDGKSR